MLVSQHVYQTERIIGSSSAPRKTSLASGKTHRVSFVGGPPVNLPPLVDSTPSTTTYNRAESGRREEGKGLATCPPPENVQAELLYYH